MPTRSSHSSSTHTPAPDRRAERSARADAASVVRAGQRARSIADACERLGLPAILLDRTGRVLHVGASAASLIGDDLTVTAEHVVGTTPGANREVERAVAEALGVQAPGAHRAPEAEDADASEERVAGLPVHDNSPFQLLRGLLVFTRRGEGERARLDTLRAMLAV